MPVDGLEKARKNLLEEGLDLATWDISAATSLKGMFSV
jgi:hypothetical protein